jgi:AraC-like DNA-binding protein
MAHEQAYRDIDLGEDGEAEIHLADMLTDSRSVRTVDDAELTTVDQAAELFARGRYRAATVRPFVQYMDCDIEVVSDLSVKRAFEPFLCLCLLMQGSWSSAIGSDMREFGRTGVPLALTLGEPLEIATVQCAGRRCRMVSIYVDAQFFNDLDDDDPLQCLRGLLTGGYGCRELPGFGTVCAILRRLYDNPYRGSMAKLHAESLALSAIVELAVHLHGGGDDAAPRRADLDKLHEVKRLLGGAHGPLPSIARLAAGVGMSETTLRRLFKKAFGTTIVEYARNERLEAARVMLRDRRFQIAEIAYRIGYSDPANFTTAFKHRFGYPPKFENRS